MPVRTKPATLLAGSRSVLRASALAAPLTALLAGALVVTALTAPPLTGGAAAAPANDIAALRSAVTGELLDRAARLPEYASTRQPDTKVTVLRSHGRWALGAAVLIAPRVEGAEPRDWLFLARRGAAGWRYGFDGRPRFARLAERSPLLSDRERNILGSHGGQFDAAANGDFRTGMRLPWARGQSWTLRGGPHAWDAGSGPWSSLDLAGGDQKVRAARAGVAYTTCVGRILVYHNRGYTTRHYHLINYRQFNGQSVSAGAFLGYTGTEVGCGGSASSRHVHFSLKQNGSYVGIARHIIGKWVPMNGSAQYRGYALHGSTRVNVGGRLYNYGRLGFRQGIVDTVSGTTLNKRSGPGTGYRIVGSANDGVTLTVACSRNGTTHSGRWGTTSLWNKLSDGTWVSGAYLYTGKSGPVNGWC